MAETIEPAIAAPEKIAEAFDFDAAVEERFGDKKEAEVIRTKNKAKNAAAVETKVEPSAKQEEKPAVIETKVEKPAEAKTETKVEGKKESDSDFFDPFEKKDSEKKVEKKDPEPTTTYKAEDLKKIQEYDNLKKEVDTYNKIKSDPVISTLITAIENGKQPIEAIMELQPVDYSVKGATADESAQIDTWRAREYFSKVEGLKEQELQDAIEEFTSMDEGIAKRRERNAQVASLTEKQNTRLQDYNKTVQASETQRQSNITKFQKDIEDFTLTVKSQKQLFGMQLADDDMKVMETGMRSFFDDLFNEDGSVNIKHVAHAVFFENFNKKRMKEATDKVKKTTTAEVLKEIHQPDPNDTVSNRAPQTEQKNWEQMIDDRFGKPIINSKK